MKVVLFSDLHLDAAFTTCADAQSARARRQSLRDTLEKTLQLAIDVKANAVLCGGDLYEHERFSPDTAAYLRSAFARLHPVPIYISPGNHDWFGPQSLYHTTDWSPNVHIFSDSRLQAAELDNGLTLWGAAHRGPANTAGFLDDFRVDRSGVHLALFHGSERGWFPEQDLDKTLHAPFDAEQIEQSGLHHAFLGHYHRPKDAALFTYPGNPDPLTFGEDGPRGVVVATVHPDGAVERRRQTVATTEAHEIRIDVSTATSLQDIRSQAAEALRDLTGVARVSVMGELASHIDLRPNELQNITHQLLAVQFDLRQLHTAYDIALLREEGTVRGEFIRKVEMALLPEDTRRRVLTTGLRALDGRRDMEVI